MPGQHKGDPNPYFPGLNSAGLRPPATQIRFRRVKITSVILRLTTALRGFLRWSSRFPLPCRHEGKVNFFFGRAIDLLRPGRKAGQISEPDAQEPLLSGG